MASRCEPLPAEWHPHAACIMAWCAAHDLYTAGEIAAIHAEQAAIARAIAGFEPVTMLVNPGGESAAAAALGPGIGIVTLDHYDTWTRDTLPVFSRCDGVLTATSLNFNVWGEKYRAFAGYDADRTLAGRFAGHWGGRYRVAPLVAEGGAIETDGVGTLLTTETCLLNPNRNPGLSRREIEDRLMRWTGTGRVVWLWGSEADTITDGHVDGIARFIRPGLAVVEVTDDRADPEYRDLRENAARLEAARDARNERLEVIRLLRPRWDRMPERGPDFAATYVNSYFANGGIVMPRFGDAERDGAARTLFARLEPDRRIIQIAIDQIAEAGGGIHCCTMQIPA